MPKGVRDHQHESPGSIEKLYLKVGEADPNTSRPDEVHNGLLPEAERKIFVQVAALSSMNATDTFEFMRQFVRPNICHSEVANMIDNYREDIIGARNAVALYVDQKFPSFNPFKQAETINRGLSMCTKLMGQYSVWIDREPQPSQEYQDNHSEFEVAQSKQEMAAKWVDRAQRGLSSVTKSYESWGGQKVVWGKMVDEICAEFAAQRNPAQAAKLDPRKIASVARQIGVDDFIADRLAQLLVYGEQNLGMPDEEEDETSKYFEDGEETDGPDILPGIEGEGVPEPEAAQSEDTGPSVPDSESDQPADDHTSRRVLPRVNVTRSILAS